MAQHKLLFVYAVVRSLCTASAAASPAGSHGPAPVALGAALEGGMDSFIEDSKVDVLTSGHIWTESPLWSRHGQFLLYVDVHMNRMYRWSADRGATIFANNTGTMGPAPRFPTIEQELGEWPKEPGSSAIEWTSAAEEAIYMTQFYNRRIISVRLLADRSGLDVSSITVVADAFNGKALNSPNDMTLFQGNLYFTDPPFGFQKTNDIVTHFDCPLCVCYTRIQQDVGVYMVRLASGTIIKLASMPGPNGIAVHAATRRLLISNGASATKAPDPYWVLYDLNSDGTIPATPRRTIRYDNVMEGKYYKATGYNLVDGVTAFNGGFFVAGPGGIYAMNADGETKGRLRFYHMVSNIAITGTHMYLSAEKFVLRAQLATSTLEQSLANDPGVATYDFTVDYFKIYPDGRASTYVQGVNYQYPAPEIHVNHGQRLYVKVRNKMKTEGMSIHFHGFEFRYSPSQPTRPGYDGAVGISSCEIPPGDTFVFDFVVDDHPGTYFYHDHGHPEGVGVRGLMGAVVVHPATGSQDPHASLYDGRSSEHVLMLHDFWSKSSHELHVRQHGGFSRSPSRSLEGNFVGIIPFESALINGRGWFKDLDQNEAGRCHRICSIERARYGSNPNSEQVCLRHCQRDKQYYKDVHTVNVRPGERVRLRIINAGALYAMKFSIDGHRMKVIATDGADVEPVEVDALAISAGERFDVIIEANQPVDSYWIRSETTEEFSHAGYGIFKYAGSTNNTDPTSTANLDPVILNCVDLGPLSSKCLPITVLRRHHSQAPLYAPNEVRPAPHSFEIAWRGMAGLSPGHFMRLLDLRKGPNEFKNQFDGDYVQFAVPYTPPMFFGNDVLHKNTLTLRVEHEEYVELILQQVDRAAHPFHLHGHKFEVMSIGYPDFDRECSVMWCQEPWYRPETHGHTLADPTTTLLKDTVFIPAGGWAVIRFRADNPGWWLMHCHMHIHLHDGMALVIDEAGERFYNTFWPMVQGLTSRCHGAWEGTTYNAWIQNWQTAENNRWKYDTPFKGDALPVGCKCWQNPDMVMDTSSRDSYECTNYYLCHQHLNSLDPPPTEAAPRGKRDRREGRKWRIPLCIIMFLFTLTVVLAVRHSEHRRQRKLGRIQAKQDTTNKLDLILSGMEGIHNMKNDLSLHFDGLVVQNKDDGSTVLRGATGSLDVGEMCCVMGGHPDSKLALLKLLSGQSLPSHMIEREGGITAKHDVDQSVEMRTDLKGLSHKNKSALQEQRLFRSMCGYVQDLVLMNLTCIEILYFTGMLENPMRVNRVEMYKHVLVMIESFGLHDVAGQKLGEMSKRHRVILSIACELLFPKVVLAMDDPSDFLSSNSTQKEQKSLMSWLDSRAKRQGCIVLVGTSHLTPPVMHHFDKLILMKSPDQIFYHGPADMLPLYFEMVDRAIPDPKDGIYWNPTDWYIDRIENWNTDLEPVPTLEDLGLTDELAEAYNEIACSNSMNSKAMDQIVKQTSTSKKNRKSEMAVGEAYEKAAPGKRSQPPMTDIDKVVPGIQSTTGTRTWLSAKRSSMDKKSGSLGTRSGAGTGSTSATDCDASTDTMDVVKSADVNMDVLHHRISFPWQVIWLLWCEIRSEAVGRVNFVKLSEVFGLGIIGGCVWFTRNSDDSMIGLRETIGLCFFTTAMWSIPPVYQALASVPPLMERVRVESKKGLYSVTALWLARSISDILLQIIWPPLWLSTAYAFADVGKSFDTMLVMWCIISLHVLSMQGIAITIGVLVPNPVVNSVVATIISQLLLIVNGFYTDMPVWVKWTSTFSPARYTFQALIKLEFSWRDSFYVHPHVGWSNRGYAGNYLPAEMTASVSDLKRRGLDVLQSPKDPSFHVEFLFLTGMFCFGRILLLIAMHAVQDGGKLTKKQENFLDQQLEKVREEERQTPKPVWDDKFLKHSHILEVEGRIEKHYSSSTKTTPRIQTEATATTATPRMEATALTTNVAGDGEIILVERDFRCEEQDSNPDDELMFF